MTKLENKLIAKYVKAIRYNHYILCPIRINIEFHNYYHVNKLKQYMTIRQFVNYYFTTELPSEKCKNECIDKISNFIKLNYESTEIREFVLLAFAQYSGWPIRFIIGGIYKARHYLTHIHTILKYIFKHNHNLLNYEYQLLVKHHIIPKLIYNEHKEFVQKYYKIPNVIIYTYNRNSDRKNIRSFLINGRLVDIEIV